MLAQIRTMSLVMRTSQESRPTNLVLRKQVGHRAAGGQPPPKENENDFDDGPEKGTEDGPRVCPDCRILLDRGVIKCDCGWTSQRKEQKRREEDGRKAAGLLNITYVVRFSDRGVRSKASDHEREFRHYFKRALKTKTIRDDNVVVMRFTGVVDRMNREKVFRDQMVARL